MAGKIEETPAELERILRFLHNKIPNIVTKEEIIRAFGEKIFNQYRDYLLDRHVIEIAEGTNNFKIISKNVIDEFNNIRKDKFNEQITNFNRILAYATVVLALGTIYPIATDIFGKNSILQGILILIIIIITILLIINFFKTHKIYKNL